MAEGCERAGESTGAGCEEEGAGCEEEGDVLCVAKLCGCVQCGLWLCEVVRVRRRGEVCSIAVDSWTVESGEEELWSRGGLDCLHVRKRMPPAW